MCRIYVRNPDPPDNLLSGSIRIRRIFLYSDPVASGITGYRNLPDSGKFRYRQIRISVNFCNHQPQSFPIPIFIDYILLSHNMQLNIHTISDGITVTYRGLSHYLIRISGIRPDIRNQTGYPESDWISGTGSDPAGFVSNYPERDPVEKNASGTPLLDSATHYMIAVPMKKIDSISIAESLMKQFDQLVIQDISIVIMELICHLIL